jgi:hypothetical protein
MWTSRDPCLVIEGALKRRFYKIEAKKEQQSSADLDGVRVCLQSFGIGEQLYIVR